jgi:hypothetical protein
MDDQTILRNLIHGGHGADAHALAAMERMVDWVQHHGGTLEGEGSTSGPLFDEVAAELAELRNVLTPRVLELGHEEKELAATEHLIDR